LRKRFLFNASGWTPLAQTLFNSMTKRKGMAPELARAALLRTEPFDQYPELVATLTEEK